MLEKLIADHTAALTANTAAVERLTDMLKAFNVSGTTSVDRDKTTTTTTIKPTAPAKEKKAEKPAETAPPVAPAAETAAPVAPAPSAPEIPYPEVQAKVVALATLNRDRAVEILKNDFGVAKAQDMKPSEYARAIKVFSDELEKIKANSAIA